MSLPPEVAKNAARTFDRRTHCKENEAYETIDLLEVLNAVCQHILAIILTTLVLAAASFGVSKFLMTPKYEASALMIVNTRQGHLRHRHQRPD